MACASKSGKRIPIYSMGTAAVYPTFGTVAYEAGNIRSNSLTQRGTRQGCPLYPLLFAVAMEPVACRLRQVLQRRGIQIGQTSHVVSLYADDDIIYSRQPDISAPIMLNVMAEFWGTVVPTC